MDETQKIALTEQYEAESTTEVPNTLSSSNNSSKISVSQTRKKFLTKKVLPLKKLKKKFLI